MNSKLFDCAVIIISGGKPRVDLTVQALKSINEQSMPPTEKIFVNHGHHEHIMEKLFASEQLDNNWKIINFPISGSFNIN